MSVSLRAALSPITRASLCVALLLAAASVAMAQQPPPAATTGTRPPAALSVEEATELASGWTLLAQGQAAQASAKASRTLERFPRSGAALFLAVEADILRTGARSGLDRYERWLGARTFEEPAVLQRIGRAVLFEELARQQDPRARTEAWRGLTDDGVPVEAPFGANGPSRRDMAGMRAQASLGDERAVRVLTAELPFDSVDRVRTIEALGASGSRLAVDPLVQLLQDARQEVRGAAVDALGRTGELDTASKIRPLLSDRSLFVRARAAGALCRLGDYSGLPVLEALASEETPSIRLLAAEMMASRPDATWSALVRDLTGSEDPEIRAGAARLVAEQDPGLARSVLDALLNDANPAVRGLAALNYGDIVASCDLPTLRRLLRLASPLTRVRAAARILSLLR